MISDCTGALAVGSSVAGAAVAGSSVAGALVAGTSVAGTAVAGASVTGAVVGVAVVHAERTITITISMLLIYCIFLNIFFSSIYLRLVDQTSARSKDPKLDV
jgi:hypothetical protein